jgi:hypothetical protein
MMRMDEKTPGDYQVDLRVPMLLRLQQEESLPRKT